MLSPNDSLSTTPTLARASGQTRNATRNEKIKLEAEIGRRGKGRGLADWQAFAKNESKKFSFRHQRLDPSPDQPLRDSTRFSTESLYGRYPINSIEVRWGLVGHISGNLATVRVLLKPYGRGVSGVVARAKYLAVYIRRSIGATERDRHSAHDQFRYDQVENVFRCPQGQTLRYRGLDHQTPGYFCRNHNLIKLNAGPHSTRRIVGKEEADRSIR